jgi:hypothetical protein
MIFIREKQMSSTRSAIFVLTSACLVASGSACAQCAPPTKTPFQTNNGQLPPGKDYSGPLFALSAGWPTDPPAPLADPPWRKAIGDGPITVANASAYAAALKRAVARNARALLMDYKSWDAAKAGWYNEPWLGGLREAIHGTYPAGEFGPAIFPGTGLRATFNTHVLTYYDARAAYTLYHFWGAQAMTPTLATENAQFVDGAISVKAAVFASTDPKMPRDWWDAMKGSEVWPLYIPVGDGATPQVWPGYVAQFDIIVKDVKSAPKTGWVFMTLVYDADAPGDFWDKMVPLGVQWGNDPQAGKDGDPLIENWNNPAAPKYSKQTLGWGGRLTGPNDGGRNDIAVAGKVIRNAPDSSCMSCHSTAQWNIAQHRMTSFLLPSFETSTPPGFQLCGDDGKPNPNGTNICSPAPGSPDWMKWFQNRPGDQPMDAGSFATDFDEVFSFKSLPIWYCATQPSAQPAANMFMVGAPLGRMRFNQYTGAPLREH